MKIEIHNLRCKVVAAEDAETRWLRGYLTFPTAGSHFTGSTGLHLFNAFHETFPAGLLPLVEKGMAAENGTLEVDDKRQVPTGEIDEAADIAWLRDYQREAVDACLAKARGILKMPTGSGKTEVACALSLKRPCRWLFLVHRTSLLQQTAERYETRTGHRAGRIGDKQWDAPEDATFVVATFQTVHAALRGQKGDPRIRRARQLLESMDGLIVDECHVLPAASFLRVTNAAKNAYYRIGMSGTPLARGDKRSVFAVAQLGPIIYTLPAKRLVDAGVLARPHIKMVGLFQRHACEQWARVEKALIVESEERNALVCAMAKRVEKPALVFVREIQHGHTLQRLFERRGVRSEFVFGKDSTESRRANITRLVRGDLDVVICSVVFQEGLDVPQLRGVVVACGGKSIIAALQRIGRGMRKATSKDDFEVWDIGDRGNRWMQRHTRARYRAYKNEGYEVTLLTGGQVENDQLVLSRKELREKELLLGKLLAPEPQA
jgi:superfamily II DNA or RNA helicase